jgi:hypothetical protein
MLDDNNHLNEGIFVRYTRGKPYSGWIREKEDGIVFIGRCKKGQLVGPVKIEDEDGEILWEKTF